MTSVADLDGSDRPVPEGYDGRSLARQDRKEALREDHIAAAFYEAYERLAPKFSYQTREASAVPWDEVLSDNKRLMRAVVRDLLDKGVITDRIVRRSTTGNAGLPNVDDLT